MISNTKPIGVFDSGLGGLTVVRALRELLPNESIIYFGDTARVPYGNKSQNLIQEYSKQITEFLIGHATKIVVVACNTASALALAALRQAFELPIVGVIAPGAKAARSATKNHKIGIIGTVATINSQAYEETLIALDKNIKSFSKACPLFVPLVEEGWTTGKTVRRVASHYLISLQEHNIDTLILGCTHYPLLQDVIAEILGNSIRLIDSTAAVALAVRDQLAEAQLLTDRSQAGNLSCYITDVPLRFEEVGERFLGISLDNVHTVHDF